MDETAFCSKILVVRNKETYTDAFGIFVFDRDDRQLQLCKPIFHYQAALSKSYTYFPLPLPTQREA